MREFCASLAAPVPFLTICMRAPRQKDEWYATIFAGRRQKPRGLHIFASPKEKADENLPGK